MKKPYSLGQRTSSGTDATAAWEIIAGAGGAIVHELGVSLAAATASIFGLGRPAAKGVTPSSPVLFQPDRVDDGAGLAAGALAWSTGPTVPAAFLRRVGLPAAVGEHIVWRFERGLFIAPSTTIVLWNLGTNAVADVYAVISQ